MESLVVITLFAFMFGGITAYIAHEKNRGTTSWFLVGFCFGIIGLLIVACVPSKLKTGV
jgi:hypothetical protein